MKALFAAVALAAAFVSMNSYADDLTAEKAEALLKPVMATDCGTYYTEQDNPDFVDIDSKQICSYKPTVTHITMGSGTATVEYTHDRQFDPALANAWLADCTKMEAHTPPSLLYQKLKSNLQKWMASGGIDKGYRPARATFKLDADGWHVASAP